MPSARPLARAPGLAGTPVDAIANCDHFSITTLPTYTGPDVHVYSIEGAIADVNIEFGTEVGTDGVGMEFSQAEIADATPTNLRRAVGAGGHLSAIARWSRSQPPGSDPLPWHAETIPAATLAPRSARRCQRHACDRVRHHGAASCAV